MIFCLYITGHGSEYGACFAEDGTLAWKVIIETLLEGAHKLVRENAKQKQSQPDETHLLKTIYFQLIIDTCHSGSIIDIFQNGYASQFEEFFKKTDVETYL